MLQGMKQKCDKVVLGCKEKKEVTVETIIEPVTVFHVFQTSNIV